MKRNAVDLVFLPTVDFIDEHHLIGLPRHIDLYCNVEISLLLKVVDQVLLSLFHQVAVDTPLGVNRNKLSHLSSPEERQRRKFGAGSAHGDNRAKFHLERNIDTIVFRMILGSILLDAAGQPTLLR